ncbi:hypothetical protein, partial [Xanthobacter flavus]|uniref:hypothetical protein n=1 Tax=Xanthobacter flavus TaxID=281 RepID=UPI003726B2D6
MESNSLYLSGDIVDNYDQYKLRKDDYVLSYTNKYAYEQSHTIVALPIAPACPQGRPIPGHDDRASLEGAS